MGAEGRDWEGNGSKVDGELAAEEPAAGVEETEGIEGVQVLLHVAGCDPKNSWSATEAMPVEIGLSIPRLPDTDGIRRFVKRAEELGFESVLAGDHIVLPTEGTDQYPYTANGSFSRPSDEPFLETMTMLGYMAACRTRSFWGRSLGN